MFLIQVASENSAAVGTKKNQRVFENSSETKRSSIPRTYLNKQDVLFRPESGEKEKSQEQLQQQQKIGKRLEILKLLN